MADVHYKFDRGGVAGLQDDSAVLTSDGDVRDYFALLKPRVMSLVIFTALVGIVVAPGTMHPVLAFVALLCIAVGAGASGALNMWYDADIDGEMQRTAARPIPRGLVTAQDALSFGTFLSFASVITLGMLVNWLSAAVLAFTIGFYLFIYTMWLKRKTPYNIVIGGAAGAFPPLLGWVAATGSLSVEPVVLFAIIFLWTPPHSWALALFRNRDYTKVSVPMLPVVSGRDETRRQIWLYSLPMVVVAMAPYVMGFAGIVYAVVVAAASAFFLKLAWTLYRTDDEKEGDKLAKQLFGFSILWMLLVFAVLLAEHAFGLGGFVPTFVGGGA